MTSAMASGSTHRLWSALGMARRFWGVSMVLGSAGGDVDDLATSPLQHVRDEGATVVGRIGQIREHARQAVRRAIHQHQFGPGGLGGAGDSAILFYHDCKGNAMGD